MRNLSTLPEKTDVICRTGDGQNQMHVLTVAHVNDCTPTVGRITTTYFIYDTDDAGEITASFFLLPDPYYNEPNEDGEYYYY
jgi:hypothetical protein